MTTSTTARRRQVGCNLWPIIAVLTCLVALLTALFIIRLPAPNRNQLAIGGRATLETLDIPLQPPEELDFLSKAEVLRLRTEAVMSQPDLMVGAYRPSDGVFAQIEDGLPWWGTLGNFYYGPGEQSLEGPAEEARFILNPYVLVAAEVHSYWDRNNLPEASARQTDFPLYCAPSQLRWQPRAAYAEVSYSAQCAQQAPSNFFDLIVYNARDLNLNYIYVSYADSQNIAKFEPPTSPYAIPQFIHRGGSCGYPGGCNNMSPPTPEIDALELTGFPARVVTWLWTERPASAAAAPEMTFVIHFR
jgi:hypothetical protein